MPKDYYAILGVDKSATDSEIKWAFRQRAKSLHPDLNPGADAQAAFQELNEAYSVLSDSSTRARYDNGELSEPEMTFTWEEVEQILRERELRRQRERGWDGRFIFQNENRYPPMDYKANEKASQKVNLAIMLIMFTFVLDFFIFTDIEKSRVTERRHYGLENSKGEFQRWIEIKTPEATFSVLANGYVPEIGEEVELKSSLFYKNHLFKTAEETEFKRAYDKPIIMYGLAGFTFLVAWLGTSRFFSPERKFNAAVIAGFLCVPILILFLYSR